MSAPRQLVTLSVRHLLEQHPSLRCYPGFMPDTPKLPLTILHSLPGGRYDGPQLSNPEADAWYLYQFDVVGTRMDQVEKGRDELIALVHGRTPTGEFVNDLEVVPGFGWADRLPSDTPGGVDTNKASSGTVYTAQHRFTVVLTPLIERDPAWRNSS
jgi:hypothetical protein